MSCVNGFGEGSIKKTKKRKHDALNDHTSLEVHIKTEPDTDHGTEKKSKKSKLKHKLSMKLEKNDSEEESFLNIKVKEEESKFKLLEDCHSIKNESVKSDDSESKSRFKKFKKKKLNKFSDDQIDVEDKAKVKHKKKNKRSASEELQLSQDEPLTLQQNGNTLEAESGSTEDGLSKVAHCETKKKHNKKPYGDIKIYNNMEIEDHFSAEETLINTPKKRKKSSKNKKLSEQIVFEDEDIINSQQLAESDHEPHTTTQAMSEDEAPTADRQPSPETHKQPPSPNSHSMSEYEDDPPPTTHSQPSTIHDQRNLQARLAAYVASLETCRVVEATEGVGEGLGGEADGGAGEVEAWVVVAPRSLAASSVRLVEVCARGRGACKLKAECGRYVGAVSRAVPSLAVVTRGAGHGAPPTVRCLPLHGAIRFHKKLPKISAAHDLLPDDRQTTFIPLPTTKTRHPLFGADYRASIKVPDSVIQQLEDARRIKKKSKKSKKVDRNETADLMVADEVIHVKVEKSKKKGKRKLSAESPAMEVELSQPKRKKKKQQTENGDVWQSQRDMEETLFHF